MQWTVEGDNNNKNAFQHKLGACVDSLEEVPLMVLTHTGLLAKKNHVHTPIRQKSADSRAHL